MVYYNLSDDYLVKVFQRKKLPLWMLTLSKYLWKRVKKFSRKYRDYRISDLENQTYKYECTDIRQYKAIFLGACIIIITKFWEDDYYFDISDMIETIRNSPENRGCLLSHDTLTALKYAERAILMIIDYDIIKITRECFYFKQRDEILNELLMSVGKIS